MRRMLFLLLAMPVASAIRRALVVVDMTVEQAAAVGLMKTGPETDPIL